jgi:hypothetical protein
MSEPLKAGDRVKWCKAFLDIVADVVVPLSEWVDVRGTALGPPDQYDRVPVQWDDLDAPPVKAEAAYLTRA